MRTPYLITATVAVLLFIVGAGNHSAYGQRRLKVVEQYNVNGAEYQVNPKTATRRIEYLYLYDAAQKVAERWDFLGNYYRRHVFSHDRKGRISADLTYESTHLSENDFFKVERSLKGVKVLPTVSDTLTEITLTEYNERDRAIEEKKTDSNGILKEKVTREFDRYNNITLLRKTDSKGSVIDTETRWTCSSDGRRCESLGREKDGTVVKNIATSDEKYRSVLDEIYRYASSAQKTEKPLLTGRSVRSYDGDQSILDWFIFNDEGIPTQRLIIVDKGEQEISRKTFAPSIGDDGTVKWLPDTEELRECTFDKGGECTTEIWKERKSGEAMFKFTLVYERLVSWY